MKHILFHCPALTKPGTREYFLKNLELVSNCKVTEWIIRLTKISKVIKEQSAQPLVAIVLSHTISVVSRDPRWSIYGKKTPQPQTKLYYRVNLFRKYRKGFAASVSMRQRTYAD